MRRRAGEGKWRGGVGRGTAEGGRDTGLVVRWRWVLGRGTSADQTESSTALPPQADAKEREYNRRLMGQLEEHQSKRMHELQREVHHHNSRLSLLRHESRRSLQAAAQSQSHGKNTSGGDVDAAGATL